MSVPKVVVILSSLFLVLLCGACCSRITMIKDARGGNEGADPWFRPPPFGKENDRFGEDSCKKVRFWEVSKSGFEEAEYNLSEVQDAIVEIESDQLFMDFGIKDASVGRESKLFLVRALYFVPGPCEFEVRLNKAGKLAVLHFSLAKGPVTMHRSALIVELLQKPADVYVECHVAE